MRVIHPEWLLALAALIWFWRAGRQAPTMTARRRRLRCGAAGCLILAASGLQLRRGDAPLAVMIAVDESGSMRGVQSESQARLHAIVGDMRTSDRAGLVRFATSATLERRLATTIDLMAPASSPVGTTTDLESAIRLARASLPSEGPRRIVLVSDGRETHGDALREAARAGAAGVPIDIVATASPAAPSLDVTQVIAPLAARVGETFDVTAVVRGAPGRQGTVALTSGGDTRRATVTVASDGVAHAVFPVRADEAGVRVFEATAQATDLPGEFAPEPRRAGTVVPVAGDTQVLYVGTTPQLVTPWLRGPGFVVREIAPAALPRSAGALADYDGIILDAPPPDAIDAAQANALRAHVERQGGGVLFLGTRDTLEPGLMASTAIGDLLPIDVRPRGGQRAPTMGLVVAFDKSGSMDDRVDGVPRIEFARLAVRRVFDAVSASDAVGVIAFDSAAHVVAPLATHHDKAALSLALQGVQPAGATAIAPAIELAAQWLRQAEGVSRRYVLLVSDGRTAAEDIARARAILERREFELSVVALGADADRQVMQSLALPTGGRAYFAQDIRDLPAIAARESARVAGGRLVDTPFRPVVRAHPVTAGLGGSPLPELGGYVVSVVKPSADAALQSPLEDPILATWRLGLGRVAAYTAELHAPWSSRLRAWDGFSTLLTQTVRWTSRSVRHDALYARIEEDADGLRVIVEARSENATPDHMRCRATVRTPTGDAVDLVLHSTAPGRYEARLRATEPGAYVFAISAESEDRRVDARLVRGLYWSADREYRHPGADLALLARIAETSGGRLLQPGESVFAGPRGSSFVDAWPWLSLGALLLFLMEILLPLFPRTLRRSTSMTSVRRHAKEAA